MDLKRLTRGPVIWVIAALIVVIVGARVLSPNSYAPIDTSEAIGLIKSGQVTSATLVNGDQRLDLTVSPAYKGHTQLETYYIDARGPELVQLLDQYKPKNGYNDQNPQSPWWSGLLFTVLPLVIILGLFWFLMGQMQGGGSRVMNFGKSRAKLVNKDMPKVTFAGVKRGKRSLIASLVSDQRLGILMQQGVSRQPQPSLETIQRWMPFTCGMNLRYYSHPWLERAFCTGR